MRVEMIIWTTMTKSVAVWKEDSQIASGAIGDRGENVRMVGKVERNPTLEIIAREQRKKLDHVQEKQDASGVIGDLGEDVRMVGKDERNHLLEIIAREQFVASLIKKVDHVQWMVVGVLGEGVANLVDLEVREDHAQILDQQMEDPNVLDLQVELATLIDVVWMVVGVPGEVVANLVDLEVREDHAQILAQQMEDPNVMDLQVKLVTLIDVVEKQYASASGVIGDLGEDVRMVGKPERNHL